jgi:hypothetical protein
MNIIFLLLVSNYFKDQCQKAPTYIGFPENSFVKSLKPGNIFVILKSALNTGELLVPVPCDYSLLSLRSC